MESSNIHHHHLQDQLVAVASSSSSSSILATITTPSNFYGPAGTTAHATWNLHSFLDTNGISSCQSETIVLNPRHQENPTLLSSQYMTSDLGLFHWPNMSTSPTFTTINHQNSSQDLHMSRIKEDLPSNNYNNFLKTYNEMLTNGSPSSSCSNDELSIPLQENSLSATDFFRQRNEQRNNSLNNDKFLLKSLSSSSRNLVMDKINHISPHVDLYGAQASSYGRGFSQIFPSVNISNNNNNNNNKYNNNNNNNDQVNLEGVANIGAGTCLDMNLQAIDLLASSRFGGENCFGQNQMRDGISFNGFDNMQQSHHMPLDSSSKISSLSSNGSATEGKRGSHKMEPKAIQTSAPKKSRLEARASCPPFKVRKEKLGDRIAALQQLVAPFGKTDTASVLMEAIGYIKFLQNQVETLSVPYMKTSRNKTSRVMKAGIAEVENEPPKRDLKSRGLCLVPLSCLSYIPDGGGATVWPPPHFGGTTG